MSFIRYNKQPQLEEPVTNTQHELHIRIDVAPIPQGASQDISMETRQMQTKAVEQVRQLGKDLFAPNNTVVTNTAGERLYQTRELYSQQLAVEDMIPLLTESGLTLRVNAIREGMHGHTTCMELKTGVLADLLKEAVDNNNEKTTSLTLTNSTDKGEMFVSVREIKGKHYINKVDYKVNSFEDDRLHVK